MLELEQIYRVERRRGIIALEGWDASGKSGAIQRLIEKLDPRWVQVWSISRPSPEEQGRHYLWRFWQRLPPPGQIAIFDRTWYGRVLVERVEGLARPKEWRRAYDEINGFEKMLVDDGVRLVKLFLHTSDGEQLRRFQERIASPTKRWKMSAEDIRNQARRRDYLAALDDMFALTSTAAAPWHVVPAEYKWFARIAVAKTVVNAFAKGIALGPPPRPRSRPSSRRNHESRGEGGARSRRAAAGERLRNCLVRSQRARKTENLTKSLRPPNHRQPPTAF